MKSPNPSRAKIYLPVAGGRALYTLDHVGINFIDCFRSPWKENNLTLFEAIDESDIPDKIIPFRLKLK